MLKVIAPTLMLLPGLWLAPASMAWRTALFWSFTIAAASIQYLGDLDLAGWSTINMVMAIDALSSPLLVLSCWLLPLMILASQKHNAPDPISRQRMYLSLLISLQALLLLAFSASDMLMFYVMFEGTLVPTLVIITRWGAQIKRLTAGSYMMFYTLTGSMPTLVALLSAQAMWGTLSFTALGLATPWATNLTSDKLWWAACLLAFLVKSPMYGVHLWLPKAHVEAPIAGSMVLAAILLKLGGYGMIRIMALLDALTPALCMPLIVLAMWGLVMANSTCLRQTDLKSLIAYSSVGHMALVVAGILIQTPWGFTGALILMVSHGLTSSALFCLANTNYERTHSRTMVLARGLQLVLPLMTFWWLAAALANLALPPLPNLMAELMIITSLINWSWWTFALVGPATLLTAGYTLYMFLMTQRGPLPHHLKYLDPSHTREHLLMVLHMAPLALIVFKPMLLTLWD